MKRIFAYLLIFCYFLTSIHAQVNVTELEKKLKSANGKEKFEILYQLSKVHLNISPKKSIEYGKNAIDEAKKLNDINLQADADNLVGTAYYNTENYKSAIKYYEDELLIRKNLKQESSVVKIQFNLASTYEAWEKTNKAIELYQKVMIDAKNSGAKEVVFQCYESIVRIFYNQKKYKETVDVMRAYMAYKMANSQAVEKLSILETKYNEVKKARDISEAELKEKDSTLSVVKVEKEFLEQDTLIKGKEINTLNVETQEQKLTIEEQKEQNRRQRQWIMAFALFALVIATFSVLLYKQYRAKKQANEKLIIMNAEIIEQKEEIQTQADMLLERNQEILDQKEEIQTQADQLLETNVQITKQRDAILFQKAQITDSIVYASRIQNVMLPDQETLDGIFKEYMILWRPQEIVSGDFYWVKQIKNFVIFAAADCTGHGVPGAFMSMLGISFLNEIVSKSRFDRSNDILNLLRKRVKKALNQTGKANEATDGMDMALCILDTENNLLQYSGAYNPLYLIRNNELQVIKADHQPIAIYPKERDFTFNEIALKKDDVIYIFSDGYMDQFGGERNEKLKSKRFHQLLLDVHSKPMNEQKTILNDFMDNWLGKKNSQIDDILIFGVRI